MISRYHSLCISSPSLPDNSSRWDSVDSIFLLKAAPHGQLFLNGSRTETLLSVAIHCLRPVNCIGDYIIKYDINIVSNYQC